MVNAHCYKWRKQRKGSWVLLHRFERCKEWVWLSETMADNDVQTIYFVLILKIVFSPFLGTGSGKKTLLDVIARRAQGPTRGQILLNGVRWFPDVLLISRSPAHHVTFIYVSTGSHVDAVIPGQLRLRRTEMPSTGRTYHQTDSLLRGSSNDRYEKSFTLVILIITPRGSNTNLPSNVWLWQIKVKSIKKRK